MEASKATMGGLLAVAVRCGKMSELFYVVVRLRFQIWRDIVERNAGRRGATRGSRAVWGLPGHADRPSHRPIAHGGVKKVHLQSTAHSAIWRGGATIRYRANLL